MPSSILHVVEQGGLHIRVYTATWATRLSSTEEVAMFRPPFDPSNPDLQQIGDVARPLIQALLELSGVEFLTINNRRVRIFKFADVSWHKLEPQIATAITTHHDVDPASVVIQHHDG